MEYKVTKQIMNMVYSGQIFCCFNPQENFFASLHVDTEMYGCIICKVIADYDLFCIFVLNYTFCEVNRTPCPC